MKVIVCQPKTELGSDAVTVCCGPKVVASVPNGETVALHLDEGTVISVVCGIYRSEPYTIGEVSYIEIRWATHPIGELVVRAK